MDLERIGLLLSGLAAGDSIGASVEFLPQDEIPDAYAELKSKGWPWRSVGGGPFNWQPGEPTDDTMMAWAIVRACINEGEFDPQAIAAAFVEWLHSHPKDIGGTTRRVLVRLAAGVPWHEAG